MVNVLAWLGSNSLLPRLNCLFTNGAKEVSELCPIDFFRTISVPLVKHFLLVQENKYLRAFPSFLFPFLPFLTPIISHLNSWIYYPSLEITNLWLVPNILCFTIILIDTITSSKNISSNHCWRNCCETGVFTYCWGVVNYCKLLPMRWLYSFLDLFQSWTFIWRK